MFVLDSYIQAALNLKKPPLAVYVWYQKIGIKTTT